MGETNGEFKYTQFFFFLYIYRHFLNSVVLYFIELLKKKLLENRDYFLEEEKFRNGNVKDEVDTTIDNDIKDDINSFKNLSID